MKLTLAQESSRRLRRPHNEAGATRWEAWMSAPTLRQLAAVDILAGLSDNDLGEIGRRMRHRRWPAGHPFVGHRDESRDVYFVLDGKVPTSTRGRPSASWRRSTGSRARPTWRRSPT